jgi:hypothetical protein
MHNHNLKHMHNLHPSRQSRQTAPCMECKATPIQMIDLNIVNRPPSIALSLLFLFIFLPAPRPSQLAPRRPPADLAPRRSRPPAEWNARPRLFRKTGWRPKRSRFDGIQMMGRRRYADLIIFRYQMEMQMSVQIWTSINARNSPRYRNRCGQTEI